jgi:hypothetical protein
MAALGWQRHHSRNGGGISAARWQHGSMMVATSEQGGYEVCDYKTDNEAELMEDNFGDE